MHSHVSARVVDDKVAGMVHFLILSKKSNLLFNCAFLIFFILNPIQYLLECNTTPHPSGSHVPLDARTINHHLLPRPQ